MIVTFETIKDDIEAFADDVSEAIFDRAKGEVLFTRNSKNLQFKILVDEGTIKNIKFEGETIPYIKFLTKQVANLDLLAERLYSKRAGIDAFIDGPARLDSMFLDEPKFDAQLNLLKDECSEKNSLSSKIVFITADAGHGKTALLREYQHIQAKNYLENKSDFVFWHIDLQGRQLLRLSEAFMGDLGDLRITGLWMSSIIRLLKHGKLVIAIDGFDELAAEQGSNDALSALSLLVRQLDNSGTLVAASRRTFFDTEDYLRKSKMISGKLNNLCVFNQINLADWTKEEAILYLFNKGFENPENLYKEICSLLGGQETHPILTRPFLLSQLTNAIQKYDISVSEFIGGMSNPQDPNKGVNSIIEAFVKREVEEKWKSKDTGEPYLSKEQHITILSAVAEEMWKAQTDRISLEIIETLTVIHLDEWGIDDKDLRQQIFEMVKMHALLIIPIDGNAIYRSFEHPEFKDYFTAHSLEKLIIEAYKGEGTNGLSRFLSLAQISDSLALYTFSNTILENNDVPGVLKMFEKLVISEWKPTFLHNNVGTMIPYIISGYDLSEEISFTAKVIYSSLTFESKVFKNIRIEEGTFLNTSFKGSNLTNITFVKCQFNEPCFEQSMNIENVKFTDCEFNGIRIENESEEPQIEYSPRRIKVALEEIGCQVIDSTLEIDFEADLKEHKHSKMVHRLMRAMRRTTFISKRNIEKWFKREKGELFENIIPLMETHNILERRPDKGDVWTLKVSYQEFAVAEYEKDSSNSHKFWKELREKF